MKTSRLLRASIAALTAAASVSGGAAFAQQQTPAPTTPTGAAQPQGGGLETVVVTGTSIRGVAPVGSNLVSVGEVELEKTQATNLSTLVNTIPALSTNGSLAQG